MKLSPVTKKACRWLPTCAPAYVNLGNVLNVQGKADQAIACYERRSWSSLTCSKAHYNLADVLRDQNVTQAVVRYREVGPGAQDLW